MSEAKYDVGDVLTDGSATIEIIGVPDWYEAPIDGDHVVYPVKVSGIAFRVYSEAELARCRFVLRRGSGFYQSIDYDSSDYPRNTNTVSWYAEDPGGLYNKVDVTPA